MDSKIQLTPGEIQILNLPFNREHAKEAFMLGLATSFSDAGLVPSQVEEKLRKVGLVGEEANNIWDWLRGGAEAAAITGVAVGAGAGYLHHGIDQSLAGNDDPDIMKLRLKLNKYHKLNQSLETGV